MSVFNYFFFAPFQATFVKTDNMKEILGSHYDDFKSEILTYLSSNSEHFSDKRILKFLKLLAIGAADVSEKQEQYTKTLSFLEQVKQGTERYDLKWLSILYVNLVDDDYQEVAFLLQQMDYSKIDPVIIDKLDLLRRLAKLIYFDDESEIIPALESLMKVIPKDIMTSSILWFFYHMNSEAAQPKKLIIMCNTILKILPDDYDSHFFKAFLYSESEQYTEAIESYKACVSVCQKNDELKGDIGWICMRLARCYLSLNDLPSVIDAASMGLKKYQEVIDIDGYEKIFYPAIYSLRSKAFLLQEKYDLALLDSDSALKYTPDDKYLLDLKKRILKHC